MNRPTQTGNHPVPNTMGALLKAAVAAVKLVTAEEIMPRYLRVSHHHKNDGSLCTEADIAAQNALTKKLQAILNVPVLGEEMAPAQQRALWETGRDGIWCIDPIDGTSNFVRGLPYFAVSVALIREGRTVLGVVYDPVANEMFAAEYGKGAFLNGEKLVGRETLGTLKKALASVDMKRLKKNAAGRQSALCFTTQLWRKRTGLVLRCGGALRCVSAWRAKALGLCRRTVDPAGVGRTCLLHRE